MLILNNYNKNIRILLISTEFPPGPGGIGNHAWNLARNLNNKVHVDILTTSDYADKNACKSFDEKEKISIYRFTRYPFSLITYIHRIFQIIKYIRLNNYSHGILSGYFALSMCSIIQLINKKIIITGVIHGSELLQSNLLLKLILKISLKGLDIMISVSNYTKNLIPIKTVPNQKNIIIPNGVNKELLTRNTNIDNPVKISGNPCLLTVGSITHRKGQINLIKALSIIKNKYPGVHYHCVGLPIEEKEVLEEASRLHIDKYVSIHGVIPNEQLGNLYKQADILVMLSQSKIRSCSEGFGIAILEANLFGVPALGSKNTGIEDAIVKDKTGVLVDPYSSKEILEGINLLLQNNEELSKNTIVWALQHCWDDISDRYLKAIIDV